MQLAWEPLDTAKAAGITPVGAIDTVPVSNGAGGVIWRDLRDAGHLISVIKGNYAVITGGTTFGTDSTTTANVIGFDSPYPPRDATAGTPQVRMIVAMRVAAWGTSTLANVIGQVVAGTFLGGAGLGTIIGPTTVSHVPADGTNIWIADSGWIDDSTSGRIYAAQIQMNWLTARPTTGQGWVGCYHRIRP